MPSQDNNLDELLRGLSAEGEDEDIMQDGGAPDLDALTEMSEEEIEKLLSAGGEAGSAGEPEEDVLALLEDEEDTDLQDIHDMLKKSDNNETIQADGGQDSFGTDQAARLMAEIEGAGETKVAEDVAGTKKQRALDKKRLKEERKAAKEAAKAEKKAKRKNKKGAMQQEVSQRPESQGTVKEYDMLKDRELLDNIVSKAGQIEQENAPQVDLMEVAAELSAARGNDASQEVPYEYDEESMGLDSDVDSGVMAIGLDEIDNYIPDITESQKEGEGGKKKGILSRFMAFLMEEDEEPENENVQISEENQEVIRELDKEKAEKEKKKRQKKADKKKKDTKKKDDKKKAAKPPKPKKEKKPKGEDDYVPGPKLGFKRVFPIVMLGITIGAVTFIFVTLVTDFSSRLEAKEAFEEGDYQTCFVNLHGKKLNESEEGMYRKAESILHIRMWYLEYEKLAEEGDDAKILDSLIQAVHNYPELSMYAARWNALLEVHEIYTDMLEALGMYGVTEAQAREIGALESDIAYTRAILALTGGAGSTDEAGGESQAEPEEELPDMLPEEIGQENGDFQDE